ncbi:MAG: LapA family protein [Burkholderiales bacterium]|nr:LapA family protein [Burkholderiales bacterium]
MKTLGRYLGWLLRLFLFVVLLLFAFKNATPVQLRLFFDANWEAPLVLLLLAFFVLGAALGVSACLARLFQQRREIASLKLALRRSQPQPGTARAGPQPGDPDPGPGL